MFLEKQRQRQARGPVDVDVLDDGKESAAAANARRTAPETDEERQLRARIEAFMRETQTQGKEDRPFEERDAEAAVAGVGLPPALAEIERGLRAPADGGGDTAPKDSAEKAPLTKHVEPSTRIDAMYGGGGGGGGGGGE